MNDIEQVLQARVNGATLAKVNYHQHKLQNTCTHRKGGKADPYNEHLPYDGNDEQYAVIQHQMADRTWFIKCLRCGKEWRPGIEGYEEAIKFPTRNTPSSSVIFQFRRRSWIWKSIHYLWQRWKSQ